MHMLTKMDSSMELHPLSGPNSGSDKVSSAIAGCYVNECTSADKTSIWLLTPLYDAVLNKIIYIISIITIISILTIFG